MADATPSLFPFIRRRRARQLVTRDLERLSVYAQGVCREIETVAASFGTDRLFDDRYGRIEILSVALRKRAEEVSSRAD